VVRAAIHGALDRGWFQFLAMTWKAGAHPQTPPPLSPVPLLMALTSIIKPRPPVLPPLRSLTMRLCVGGGVAARRGGVALCLGLAGRPCPADASVQRRAVAWAVAFILRQREKCEGGRHAKRGKCVEGERKWWRYRKRQAYVFCCISASSLA
jgi:hypothetical protein